MRAGLQQVKVLVVEDDEGDFMMMWMPKTWSPARALSPGGDGDGSIFLAAFGDDNFIDCVMERRRFHRAPSRSRGFATIEIDNKRPPINPLRQ